MSKARVSRQRRADEQRNGLPIDAITDRTRRAVVSTLRDRADPIDVADLAAVVTGATEERAVAEGDIEDCESTHLELVHAHLPRLADADLVEWDREAGTVSTGDHPALRDGSVRTLIDVEADPDEWDEVLGAIGSPIRRTVIDVLEGTDELERRDLARRVAASVRDVPADAVDGGAVEDLLVSLHHEHLPALADASLIECDGETVRYVGHPELDAGLVTR